MAYITVYSKSTCLYCVKALALLEDLGQAPEIIDVKENPERRPEMIEKAGGRNTVPQIFIGERYIGGCDDLLALHEQDDLIPLLK
ncbi:MAG: glutaredoxin 3 [Alphaproteobacteria bacterium]|nr:glutaredoxin 3 [Alphaproteobacteria bacterium]MDD9919150.1 glutaredoxin 3 [Alphaproteobacteria bacterium]